MNKSFAGVILLLGLALSPAFAHETPNCDALDHGSAGNLNIETDINFDFEGGDLVFREDGERRMVITETGDLFLSGERVELDARGQALVGDYYLNVEEFVDDVADLAGDAAGFGVATAVEALELAFSNTSDAETEAFEERVEGEAREIEKQADLMCVHFRRIEDIERELETVVPGFEARLFVQK